MIMVWMAYSWVVGSLLAAAAAMVEAVLLKRKAPTRALWLGTMAGMTLVSALGLAAGLQSRTEPRAVPARLAAPSVPSSPRSIEHSAAMSIPTSSPSLAQRLEAARDDMTARLSRFDGPVSLAWGALSALLALLLVNAAVVARRLRRSSESREVGGVPVLLTDNTGPAAMGVGCGQILLPRWTLDLDAQLLDFVVSHEREHLRASDPTWLMGALSMLVVLPWHLPLWWSWRRLQLAIEVDCDARLLLDDSQTARYAQLLLLVSQRTARLTTARQPLLAVTTPLNPEHSHLARRIRIMTQRNSRLSLSLVGLVALGVAASAAVAVALPVPKAALLPSKNQLMTRETAGRSIVQATSVGLREVHPDARGSLAGELQIFNTGESRITIGNGPMQELTDTIRLKTLPAFAADVTQGDVHVRLVDDAHGGPALAATVAGGSATAFTARAQHLVLFTSGAGVAPVASAPAANPAASVAAVSTRIDHAPSRQQDSTRVYFEFEVEGPVQHAPDNTAPKYPATERAAGREGTVLAQFIVNTDGRVEPGSLRVKAGTIMSADGKEILATKPEIDYGPFEIAVRDALPGFRFTPAKIKETSVRQLVHEPFVFTISK